MNTAKAHCTAITDVFNNAVNPQNGFKFAVGNKGSVQKNTAVIKLFVLGKQKAERESVPESTILMPLAAKISENSAAPSMKSSTG